MVPPLALLYLCGRCFPPGTGIGSHSAAASSSLSSLAVRICPRLPSLLTINGVNLPSVGLGYLSAGGGGAGPKGVKGGLALALLLLLPTFSIDIDSRNFLPPPVLVLPLLAGEINGVGDPIRVVACDSLRACPDPGMGRVSSSGKVDGFVLVAFLSFLRLRRQSRAQRIIATTASAEPIATPALPRLDNGLDDVVDVSVGRGSMKEVGSAEEGEREFVSAGSVGTAAMEMLSELAGMVAEEVVGRSAAAAAEQRSRSAAEVAQWKVGGGGPGSRMEGKPMLLGLVYARWDDESR